MIRSFCVAFLFFVLLGSGLTVHAQLKPHDAIKEIKRGINIGNTLDPPDGEGTWNNGPLQEYFFDDYKTAGFTCIRIPITWHKHTGNSSPYTIDAAWLNRVEEIVDWGLARGLYIIINAHHEDAIKANYSQATTRDKFDSIWRQIAERFKNKSDKLFFEMLNEPIPMTQAQLNDLNARVLAIIRTTNPTRIVIFSGIQYTNSAELLATKIPDVNDQYLMAYYHSYDPWNFAGLGNGTWGTPSDVAATITKCNQVSNWSTTNNIPVLLDEYGAVGKCDYNSKMFYLATVTEQALNHNIGVCNWDDGGDFQSYLRTQRKWNDNKDVFIYTYKESPTNLKLTAFVDSIKITWENRTSKNDSIIVDRKTATTDFVQIGKVGPTTTQFKDSLVQSAKVYYYRLRTNINDTLLYSYPQTIASISKVRKPYSGKAMKVPGAIEAENFDIGVDGLTYHDSESENLGGLYRTTEGVDIQAVDVGGYHVGYVNAGEWLEYTVAIRDSAEYVIDTYVASLEGGGEFTITFRKGTKLVSTSRIVVPKTNGWQTFQKVSTNLVIPSGNTIMRVYINATPGFNLDKFALINPLVTGIEEFNNDVVVYPNPAANQIFVTVKQNSNVEIMDLTGRKLIKQNLRIENMALQVDMLQPGTYFLKVESGTTTKWIKFVKE